MAPPSAVFTAEFRYSLRAYVREHEQPSRILNRMDKYLLESHRLFSEGVNKEGDNSPVCVALAVIDRHTGAGAVAVAAMEWPVLIRANGDMNILKASGPPLGIGIGGVAPYRQVRFQMEQGDTLIMATDGITEARYEKQFLGDQGLQRLAAESRGLPLKEMADSILNGAIGFAHGHLHDDASVVLVRRN
jgi:sigma-B regulation protein RsbU (phosphoserine phosphatase)